MGQSTQKTSSIASGPGFGALSSAGPGRIESQYQTDSTNPNRLTPQATSYTSDVLSGRYLDPNTNPNLGALTHSIWQGVAPNVESIFSRAGRGTSASASGLGGALTNQFTTALAQPLFSQYNTERGIQQQAASMAPGLDTASSLPLDQYLQRMSGLATLGQQGSQTATPSMAQMLAGAGMLGAGLFTAPMGGTSAAQGISSMFGGLFRPGGSGAVA